MAFGGRPDEKNDAEKARYRQKLAEWRAMGFDVSALEVLLETDFEKFKERRFELMRSQIHGAGPAPPDRPDGEPAIPAAARPAPAVHSPDHREAQSAPYLSRRPGLHAHFARLARPPESPPSGPEAAARPERIHTEMRLPSARRRRPEKDVRTFSVAVERTSRPRRISVGGEARPSGGAGAPRPKSKEAVAGRGAPAAARPRRPEPPEERPHEVSVEDDGEPGPGEEPAMAVEDDRGIGGRGRPGEEEVEHIAVMEEADETEGGSGPGEGGEEPGEDGAPEEEPGPDGEDEESPEAAAAEEQEESADEEQFRPSLGYFTPASRVPMKPREGPPRVRPEGAGAGAGRPRTAVKRKLRKVAVRPGPAAERRGYRGWIAVAAVAILVVAGLAGYYFLAPRTTCTARASFPPTAEAGALVSFNGGNSTTTGKGISRYDWTFGDGTGGAGRLATHFYPSPDTYVVSLTVLDQDGTRSAPFRSKITVSPLAVTVPAQKEDDTGYYSVSGSVDVKNTVSYLYKVNALGQQVTISQVQLDLNGTQTRWVRGQLAREDGFGVNHTALWTTSNEALYLSGKAYTSISPVNINGDLNYDEDSYADAASAGTFQVRSRAVTHLRSSLTGLPFSINSTDTMRAYPGVAGILAQFQPEDLYRGQSFSQSGGQTDGSFRSGNTTYYWSLLGVANIGGYSSIGLNITAEKAYLDQNGFSEFFLNVWLSASASMPTSTLVHVAGSSADTYYRTDHLATMTGFKAGSGTIDLSAQKFDPTPLPPELFYSPFVDVIAAGSGNASLRFPPDRALQEASARDGSFRDFLSQNPQSYACAGKYYEGQFGPGSSTWNLTFSWPGASSSYWINVTRDLLGQYTVHGGYGGGLMQLSTSEAGQARMLTLSSAQDRMRADPETAGAFFKDGAINWAGGTSLELEADASYPSINLASLFAAPESARYAALLRKGGDTSAFSLDTGQMMYFYTHSGS